MNTVEMAHGSGGQAMQQLINRLFMEAFNNPWLAEQEDQARIDLAALTAHGDRLAFSTDSYVIDPLFFPGGDIGKLADLRHGKRRRRQRRGPPLPLLRLYPRRRAADGDARRRWSTAWRTPPARRGSPSSPATPRWCGRGAADKLFINTAGMGAIPVRHPLGRGQQLCAGRPADCQRHAGLTTARPSSTCANGLGLDGELRSDCAVLTPLIQTPAPDMSGVKALRDATRGGVNAVAHEFAASQRLRRLRLTERGHAAVKPAVRGAVRAIRARRRLTSPMRASW